MGSHRIRHTLFKVHSALVFEVPAEHRKNSLPEAEVQRPGPNHFELHFLKGFYEVHYQCDCSFIHFFCVASPSLPSVASHLTRLFPFLHHQSTQPFPPTTQGGQKCNWSFASHSSEAHPIREGSVPLSSSRFLDVARTKPMVTPACEWRTQAAGLGPNPPSSACVPVLLPTRARIHWPTGGLVEFAHGFVPWVSFLRQ